MNAPARSKPPRGPFVLLGLMTAFSFGGPIAIGYALRGGASPNWPPDRPIEWVVFVGVSAMVFVLMMACLSLALVSRKPLKPLSEKSSSPLPPAEGLGVKNTALPVGRPEGSIVDHSTGHDPHPGLLPAEEVGREKDRWMGVEP